MRKRRVDSARGGVHTPCLRDVSSEIAIPGLRVDMWTVGRYIISRGNCPHRGGGLGQRLAQLSGLPSERSHHIGGSPFGVHCSGVGFEQ